MMECIKDGKLYYEKTEMIEFKLSDLPDDVYFELVKYVLANVNVFFTGKSIFVGCSLSDTENQYDFLDMVKKDIRDNNHPEDRDVYIRNLRDTLERVGEYIDEVEKEIS